MCAGVQSELPLDGWCHGPLFAPPRKTRVPVRIRMSGGAYVWLKWRRARPQWTTNKECDAFWQESLRKSAVTGVQHSVDHIVPLMHPLVCGLHCPANLRVVSLEENLRKSNNNWPDMWGEQEDLYDDN